MRSAITHFLLAMSLMLIAGAASTYAAPCKADGVFGCSTNASCCSKLCVSSNPPRKRAKGTCSCTGTSCTTPETCGGGSNPFTCGCTPKTCADLGATCGAGIPDGCGGTLNCGTCTAPDACTIATCNTGTYTCEYTAKNCDDQNVCTDDSCDAGSGTCTHQPSDCDDQDACTVDACDAASGCTHEPDLACVCANVPPPFTCIPPALPGTNENPDGCACVTNGDCSGNCQCGNPCTPPGGANPCASGTCITDPTQSNFGSCSGICPPSVFNFCVGGEVKPFCTNPFDNNSNQSAACCTCNTDGDCIGSCSNNNEPGTTGVCSGLLDCGTCTPPDACTQSVCNPISGDCEESPADCDDQDACTIDTCDPQSGCVHTPSSDPVCVCSQQTPPFTCKVPALPGTNENPDGCPCVTNGDCSGNCQCGNPCTPPGGANPCVTGTCITDPSQSNFGSCSGVCPPSSFNFCVDGEVKPFCTNPFDNNSNQSAACCTCNTDGDCIGSCSNNNVPATTGVCVQ